MHLLLCRAQGSFLPGVLKAQFPRGHVECFRNFIHMCFHRELANINTKTAHRSGHLLIGKYAVAVDVDIWDIIGTGDSEHALVDGVGAESAISASVMDLFNLASDNLAVFGDAVLDVELPGPAHLRADESISTCRAFGSS